VLGGVAARAVAAGTAAVAAEAVAAGGCDLPACCAGFPEPAEPGLVLGTAPFHLFSKALHRT